MLEVQRYLLNHTFEDLHRDYGIRVKAYPEHDLFVLNYDQIESPKAHPIVMECRSLILDSNLNIVSRGFDRFFNLGEQPETQEHLEWTKAYCMEKVDGSLIKIYFCLSTMQWEIATRGTAFAESEVNGFGITFRGLVLRALGLTEEEFQAKADDYMDPTITYICEVVAMENRVVKRYAEDALYFLAARSNLDEGTYLGRIDWYDVWTPVQEFGMKIPRKFFFYSKDDCQDSVLKLQDLDEGYVVYQDDIPVCKVKSPAYVTVHHIRGEGLTPKRIMQLVLLGEQVEYLTYFPEDEKHFTPYIDAIAEVETLLDFHYNYTKDIEDQKEFALAVKDHPFASCLFMARKYDKTPVAAFHSQSESYKMQLLEKYV